MVINADCIEHMNTMPPESVDSIVTDPPYHLTSKNGQSKGFMGKEWDGGDIAFRTEVWEAALRVAKPGAYLLAFGGTRTFHRMAVAIEDAGWEIRDTVMYVYGTGFPKSHNVGKAIDKEAGVEREVVGQRVHARKGVKIAEERTAIGAGSFGEERIGNVTVPATPEAAQWDGWGTALKPAWEPIIVARKPLEGTVAANVLAHGTGALNIDGCRVGTNDDLNGGAYAATGTERHDGWGMQRAGAGAYAQPQGRWPANLIHDGSDEVLAGFPDAGGAFAPVRRGHSGKSNGIYGDFAQKGDDGASFRNDTGSAARFFYCAKASKADRDEGNMHPTVKPTALMRYLCKLVTPPAGTVLDPFMGSGSTGKAARMEGFGFIGIEQDAEYIDIARARIAHAVQSPAQQSLHI